MAGVVRRLAVIVAALGAAIASVTAVQAGEKLDGFWMDSDGEVILEFGPCGDSRCGKVAWLKKPLGPDGLLLRDYRNADPNLKSRPVCGLEVVTGFKKQTDGAWGGGTVYVSDWGTSYSGFAEVLSPTSVKVTGYVGLPIFGASEVWTKVSSPFERCSASAPKAKSPEWSSTTILAPAPRAASKKETVNAPPAR